MLSSEELRMRKLRRESYALLIKITEFMACLAATQLGLWVEAISPEDPRKLVPLGSDV